MIQLRQVADELHRKLKARAAMQGLSCIPLSNVAFLSCPELADAVVG